MKRTMGILLPTPPSPFSGMPLLGKPCRAHVEQALSNAGITVATKREGWNRNSRST